MNAAPRRFVSRSGLKLDAALQAFGLGVGGWTCTDFGSHTGGFVECLLSRGAARVHAVDPGVGVLALRLREDPRVVVHEGVSVLEFRPDEPSDLVTIDVGWTPLRLVLPAARRALRPGGCVVALIKPQYEAPKAWLRAGVVPVERLAAVLRACREDVLDLGWAVQGECESPIRGHGGNLEHLWLLRRAAR